MEFERILIRATNWVGDAVMSLPAVVQVRARFPQAHIAILARPWVAGLYSKPLIDEVIQYTAKQDWKDLRGRWGVALQLRRRRFDAAILLQNAFDAAAIAWLAGIPVRIGYNCSGRRRLLTHPVSVPKPGEIPCHQRYYYLEMLRRAGLIDELPDVPEIRLPGNSAMREAGQRRLKGSWIGVSPGAANGTAKLWPADRFAEAATLAARAAGAQVAVFGSPDERELCERVAALIRDKDVQTFNFAGKTDLQEFQEMVAACVAFVANDSGAMHISSALGVPTVAVFGPTDPLATGPTGSLATIVREPVDCSPCLLHECPIDHRCMNSLTADRVSTKLLDLVQLGQVRT
jgi:heptosyltransferase II